MHRECGIRASGCGADPERRICGLPAFIGIGQGSLSLFLKVPYKLRGQGARFSSFPVYCDLQAGTTSSYRK